MEDFINRVFLDSSSRIYVKVDNIDLFSGYPGSTHSFIVPNGSSYIVNEWSTAHGANWAELR